MTREYTRVKWEKRMLELAKHVSTWSKDPSTQVGAVVVRPDCTVASVGYNGFPRGVFDDPDKYADREIKYSMVVHAEANALMAAREPLHGYTMFTHPFPPCCDCAGLIIQSGIKNIVSRMLTEEQEYRWGESMQIAYDMFRESGVNITRHARDAA